LVIRRLSESSLIFDVDVWIDFPNQVSCFYGGYGPGLYFWVDASDIERFASQLGVTCNRGLLQDEERRDMSKEGQEELSGGVDL